jgi:hypothetical protein
VEMLQDLIRELIDKGDSVEEIYRKCLSRGYDSLETLNAVSRAGKDTSEFIRDIKGKGTDRDT